MVSLSVIVRQSATQRDFVKFENVSPNSSIGELKKEILLKLGLEEKSQLELIHSCQLLKDDSTLETFEQSGRLNIIHATIVNPVPKPEPKILSVVEQNQLFLAFRSAMTNPHFRQTLQNIAKPENLQPLIEQVPRLADDQVALSMLQDWELLLHLANPKIIQLLVEKHPALVDALSRIMRPISGTSEASQRRSQAAGWLARSLGADLEDDGMDEDSPQQGSSRAVGGFGGLTPAQLAAALNFAQNSIRQPTPATSQQSSTSPSQPQRAATVRTETPSIAGMLTPEMFNTALRQAMSQMGGASSAASSQTVARDPLREDVNTLRQQFDRYLPQMRELGMNDDSLSLRALQATNGDVEAAINLIYAGLVDD